MLESLEPERVVEILNQYLTLTTRCVIDRKSTRLNSSHMA